MVFSFYIYWIFHRFHRYWYIGDQKNLIKPIFLNNLLIISVVFGISYILHPYISGFLFILFGIFFGGLAVSINYWLINVTNYANRSKVFGTNFLAEGISATLAPYIFGWLADQIGLLSIFRWSTLSLIAALAFYFPLFPLPQVKMYLKSLQR